MRTYFQGLITGGILVIMFIVLTAQGYINPNPSQQKLKSNAQRNINSPAGRFDYGMEKLNEDSYYSWIANTQTGDVIVRKIASIKNSKEVYYHLSWNKFVNSLNRK